MKSYYFFVSYQIFSKVGLLLCSGHSLERIDKDVEDGEFEHFGLKELCDKIRNLAMPTNKLVDKNSNVLITSINELSEELWNQLADGELIPYKNKEKNNEKG